MTLIDKAEAHDDDLIRRGDADAAIVACKGNGATRQNCRDAIAAIPARGVGVKERVQHKKRGSTYRVLGRGKVQTDTPLTDYAEVVVYQAEADGTVWVRPVSEFKDGRFAALEPVTPAPDAAAIGEAWERSYWRLRSYAVHDNDCKLNKPPRFDGPCSCGLTAALEEALALLTEKPHDRA
ncbi:hypothetical protein [Microcystis phage Mae-JY02]